MSGLLRRQYKVCLIGDGYVGKTSIRRKYLKGGFKASYLPTLGVDFAQKTTTYEGVPTYLVVWDIAGQPLFQSLRRRYYEGCSGMILAYSVVDRASFDNASKWLVEAHGFMGELPPLIVAGNKIDLRPTHAQEETVSTEEGEAFAKRFSEKLNTPAIFIETSALTGENIDEAFTKLIGLMVDGSERHGRVEEREMPVSVAKATQRQTAEQDVTETSMVTPEQMPVDIKPAPPSPSDFFTGASESAAVPRESEIDPVTSLDADSSYHEEDQIGRYMTELAQLREELQSAEGELAKVMSDMETELLNLKNVIHVKRIMYEHLKKQISSTRQEWADAYAEYTKLDERKKAELAERSKQIKEIRDNIEKIGKRVRRRVGELDLKKMAE
ncbi:MAG: GTP-binding protein [Candidatus Thorarchaeota archaeon]|nr:GTP-binding protein [Candidatus Bathyarchaeota archaeon]UCH05825.1 MAG: GTP-binding protein [Candidatus Thorarchaeota archaeon]